MSKENGSTLRRVGPYFSTLRRAARPDTFLPVLVNAECQERKS